MRTVASKVRCSRTLRGRAATATSASALAVALGLVLGACGAPDPASPEGVAGVADGGGVAAVAAPATSGPIVTITAPAPNASVTYPGPPGAVVTMSVNVSGGTVSPTELHLRYFLDGVEVGDVASIGAFDFLEVPAGRRHLAVQLFTAAGQPLFNPESRAAFYVRIVATCSVLADCADGLSCSNESCSGGTCKFGPVPDCCDQDFECAFGSQCVAGKCLQCQADLDCDDGNLCTDELCLPDGTCSRTAQPGCCSADADCNDKDSCTNDSCDLATNTCIFADKGDPLCCNVSADCKPDDEPCLRYLCYKNTSTGVNRCRFGPSTPGCCMTEAQCNDGNPCTADDCDLSGGTAAGFCTHIPVPVASGCCLSVVDCDDADPATIDTCVASSCTHTSDPNYCVLPATSALVINEIMAHPGKVADASGEWIELFNATDATIDLAGWSIEAGGTHVIAAVNAASGAAGLKLAPRGYYVLAASKSSSANGGFKPPYQYGAALSFDDPISNSGFTVGIVRLKNPAGVVVDQVAYTKAYGITAGHSLELVHPFADNTLLPSWRSAGTNPNPALNQTYGGSKSGLYGSPMNQNRSAYQGIPAAECSPPAGSSACTIGLCSPQSACGFGPAPGCCLADKDCDDFNPCTVDGCNTSTNLCKPKVAVPACCVSTSECDDSNPCNIDRCIGNVCRVSPNIVPGCCVTSADCGDDDACTTDTCDVIGKTCNLGIPVVPASGAACCSSAAECDDFNPATLDGCNLVKHECTEAPDPNYCELPADPCDDDDPCTADTCDVVAKRCEHGPVAGCCKVAADCPADGNECTYDTCNAQTGVCAYPPKPNCCLTAADCSDGKACTTDVCSTAHVCHNLPISGCCETAASCNDGIACTVDACVAGQCSNVLQVGCCVPGSNQTQLTTQCGPDPDGSKSCIQWGCASGACELLVASDCCDVHADCDDGSGCTLDLCKPDGLCKHLSQAGPGCCVLDSECPADSYCALTATCAVQAANGAPCVGDNGCQSGWCAAGTCAAAQANGGSCTGSNQCGSALCVDATCCAETCDDPCKACNVAGSLGACVTVAGPDLDSDGEPNSCDDDDDGDLVADRFDNCALVANPDQLNTDGDRYGDACDSDDDADGVLDVNDNCPLVENPDQADNDGDGEGDACDQSLPKVLISELYYDGPSTDSPHAFTELAGPPGMVLTGYSLVGINGADGSLYATVPLSGITIPSDGILVLAMVDATGPTLAARDAIAAVDWQNGPDCVQVRYPDGAISDALQYGNAGVHRCGEGAYSPDVPAGSSLSRDALLTDTDDNATDFTVLTTPSPGLISVPLDLDGDGIDDAKDNCLGLANSDQQNTDGDSKGDACDGDDDGDGIADADDNCPGIKNAGQADLDGDGVGDVCDVLIQEIYVDGPGADSDYVYTELVARPGTKLSGFRLVGYNGSDGLLYTTALLDGAVVPVDGILVIAGPGASGSTLAARDFVADVDWQNGPDAVQLLDPSGRLIDAVQYGDAGVYNKGEGAPAVVPGEGLTLSRDAASADTGDNAADFVLSFPTPGVKAPDPDGDGDGVLDSVDNCPAVPNADQADADSDNIGDLCDPDSDDDGILDDGDGSGVAGDNPCVGGETFACDDNCALDINADQEDLDLDGVGDVCALAVTPHVVIQEVVYDGPGADLDDVFTELVGPPGFSLNGWKLKGINGANGSLYLTISLDGLVIPPDGILVIADASANSGVAPFRDAIAAVDWQNGPDAVQLINGLDEVADALQYGNAGVYNAGEGAYAPTASNGSSLTRDLLSTDTDDNAADFTVITTPRPGAL